jgi:hypothetical protein
MKSDVPATRARKFKHPKSHVTPDGREVLHGDDWDDRRFELLQRSRGQCEYSATGTRCTREAADPHHVELRSILRNDKLSNLLAVCRRHHEILDREQRKAKIEAREARRA